VWSDDRKIRGLGVAGLLDLLLAMCCDGSPHRLDSRIEYPPDLTQCQVPAVPGREYQTLPALD
jgi:hypothetical protein